MILLVGNTKGGVGKTTLAVQIAVARAKAGREVWLIDGDRQGTAATAIDARAETGKLPGIACAKYDDGKALRAQIKQQQSKWDDIIIDAGGRDSGAMRAAMMLADVLLVPFAPRSFDIWALDDMAALVDEARETRDGLQAYVVMNQADPWANSAGNAEAEAAAREVTQFEYLNTPIRRRTAISTAGSFGLGVSEQASPDPKAVAELDLLVASLFHMNGTSHGN